MKHVNIGDHVNYVDTVGKPHAALVTEVHGNNPAEDTDDPWWPCVNLLIVSSDTNMRDHYGRQIARISSVSHDRPPMTAHGNYWKFPE